MSHGKVSRSIDLNSRPLSKDNRQLCLNDKIKAEVTLKYRQQHEESSNKSGIARDGSWLIAGPNHVVTITNKGFRLILALVGCVIYLNSLGGDFVYDDRRVILENNDVVGWPSSWSLQETIESFVRLFGNDFWGTPISNKGSHKSYRPLVILTYRLQVLLQRQFFLTTDHQQHSTSNAQLNPIPFHLVNLLLHLLVVDLIFQLASSEHFQAILLQQTSATGIGGVSKQQTTKFQRRQKLVSRLGALLFACHPIHVEAVASIVGLAELMGSLFCLLSFRNLASYLIGSSSSGRHQLFKSALYAIATFLCKENHAFSVLAINGILVCWFGMDCYTKKRRQLEIRKDSALLEEIARSKQAVSSSAQALSALLLVYAGLRQFIVTSSQDTSSSALLPKFSLIDNPLQASARQFCLKFSNHQSDSSNCASEEYLRELQTKLTLTRIYLPALNLAHLLKPSRLSYDWSLDSIGLIEGIADWRFIAALLSYVALIWFGVARLLRLIQDIKEKTQGNGSISSSSSHEDENRIAQESEAESETSDTSSVKSASTTRSIDSGVADCGCYTPANQKAQLKRTKNERPSQKQQQKRRQQSKKPQKPQSKEPDDSIDDSVMMNSLGWSLIWLLVPLFPVSNLLFWVGFIMAERTLYLPSIGLCFLVAIILVQLLIERRWIRWFVLPKTISIGPNERKMSLQLLLKLRSPQLWRSSLKSALIFETNKSFLFDLGKKRPPLKLPPTAKTPTPTKPTNNSQVNEKSSQNDVDDRGGLLLLTAVIFPLLIWGCLKTMDRNLAWQNERSLYSSNLAESPTRSLANLASLASSQTSASRENSEQLYRLALAREPLSADLHYNLARSLHGRATTADDDGDSVSGQPEEVAYHYKLALKLRENFALAALNLGSYQYASLNQLDLALETFDWCAKMRSDETKTHQQHVRVQIECLISGAKLWLTRAAHHHTDCTAGGDCASGKQQTNNNNNKMVDDEPAENCPKVLELMQRAKSMWSSIGGGPSFSVGSLMQGNEQQSIMDELEELGDTARQMAFIHWLTAKCSTDTKTTTTTTKANELAKAIEWADRSQVSLEAAQIYLDYASLSILDSEKRIEFLSRAIENQQQRRPRRPMELAKLHHGLAKVFLLAKANGNEERNRRLEQAARQMDEAIRLEPDEPGFLSLGAQLAFDLGQRNKSEQLYLRALQQLQRQNHNGMTVQQRKQKQQQQQQQQRRVGRKSKRLAQAHTNYGAILQVNGRLEEARNQYRQALDCDPESSIAAKNLANL